MISRSVAAAVATVAAFGLAGCTDNAAPAASGDARSVTVTSSDTECVLSATTAPSGTVRFVVTNTGGAVTEFYVYAADGVRIVAEVENIGPGITRELAMTAAPGNYLTACKPGMAGDGIRAAFTVTDSGAPIGPAEDDADLVHRAEELYADYVRDQVGDLLVKTRAFAELVKDGKDDQARALYPAARVHWERVETVAESFGDLDPRMDAREADLEAGQAFTGWHRLEKDLWPARARKYTPMTVAERARVADQLVADTAELDSRVKDMTFTVSEIANGAKGLLDEVATGKVTGEEEYWSRTDLWDFQANVDGARVAWEGLQPLLQKKDEPLDDAIEKGFSRLQVLMDKYRSGEGFVSYDTLTPAQVKELADAVNALAEPLSKMAGAVLS